MFGLRNFGEMDYNLLFYSYVPAYRISDMNGFGHFMKPLAWFNGYWLALGALLITVGNLMWTRGTETRFRTRLKLARQRATASSVGFLVLFAGLWLGSGAYIYYNVSVLNTYLSADESREEQAKFERHYRKLERVRQPKVTDVKLYADVYPEDRRAQIRAVCQITNKWSQPIDTLYLNSQESMKYLRINGVALKPFFRDRLLARPNADDVTSGGNVGTGFLWFKLPTPLQPGDTVTMETLTEIKYRGFPNSGFNREVVNNGTFFSGGIPSFGYNTQGEITSDKERKKQKLPERKYTQPPRHDAWD